MLAGSIGNPYRQAVLPLTFDPDGALAPPPTITITPLDDLVDGQTVHLTGDGLPINRSVGVVQCVTDREFPDGCFGALIGAGADAKGHVELDVPVHQTLQLPFEAPFDCAASPGRCKLVVLDQNFDPIASAAIDFRPPVLPPEAPPPPPPPPATDPSPTTTPPPAAEVLAVVETPPVVHRLMPSGLRGPSLACKA